MRALLPILAACALVTPVVAARADCDRHRMLDKVTRHGAAVQLDNGSSWEVSDTDQYIAQRWKQDAPITACDDELINREDHESVRARRTRRGD